jgi:hypothetical protein
MLIVLKSAISAGLELSTGIARDMATGFASVVVSIKNVISKNIRSTIGVISTRGDIVLDLFPPLRLPAEELSSAIVLRIILRGCQEHVFSIQK